MKRTSLMIITAIGVIGLLLAIGIIPGLNLSRSGQAQEEEPILKYPDSAYAPTPTMAPMPTDDAAQSAAVPLARSEFANEEALAMWEFADLEKVLPGTESVWTVKDGRLLQNRTAAANSPASQDTVALTGKPTWTDYEISAKVYDQENGTFGLVARYQGKSFYRYSIIDDRFEGTPKQLLEKVVDGVSTPLVAVESPGHIRDKWYIVTMHVSGSNIRVTLDGKVVAEATDTTLTSGQVGLYTKAMGGIMFDDVKVISR